MQFKYLFLCLFSLLCFNAFSVLHAHMPFHQGVGTYREISEQQQKQILEVADQLPKEGILVDNGEGFVFLKLKNDYIFQLYPFIQDKGFQIPSYFRRPDSPGAHISVFYVAETRRIGKPIKELGEIFTFTPKRVRIVRNGENEYVVVDVKVPELEKLRIKYGLASRLQGHDFHITIGKRPATSRWW